MTNFIDIYLDSTKECNKTIPNMDEINMYSEAVNSADYNSDIIECKLALFEYKNYMDMLSESYTYYAEAVGGFFGALLAFVKKGFLFFLKMLLGLKGILIAAVLGGIGYLVYRVAKGDKVAVSGGGGGGGSSSSSSSSKEIPKENDLRIEGGKPIENIGTIIPVTESGVKNASKLIRDRVNKNTLDKDIQKFNKVIDTINKNSNSSNIFEKLDSIDSHKSKNNSNSGNDKKASNYDLKSLQKGVDRLVKGDVADVPGVTAIEKSAYELMYEELRNILHNNKMSPSTGKTYTQLLKENPVYMLDGDYEEVTDKLCDLFDKHYEVTASVGKSKIDKTVGTFIADAISNSHRYLTLSLAVNTIVCDGIFSQIEDEKQKEIISKGNVEMLSQVLGVFGDAKAEIINSEYMNFKKDSDDDDDKIKQLPLSELMKRTKEFMDNKILNLLKYNIFSPKNIGVISKASEELKKIKFKQMTDPKDINMSYIQSIAGIVYLISNYDKHGIYELYWEIYRACGEYKKIADDIKDVTHKLNEYGKILSSTLDDIMKSESFGKAPEEAKFGMNMFKDMMSASVGASSTVFDSVNIFNTAMNSYGRNKLFRIIDADIKAIIVAKMLDISNLREERKAYHDAHGGIE